MAQYAINGYEVNAVDFNKIYYVRRKKDGIYYIKSNGVKMQLGYGVYQVTKDECERCVLDALEAGYRSIDTAQSYLMRSGKAIEKSGSIRRNMGGKINSSGNAPLAYSKRGDRNSKVST